MTVADLVMERMDTKSRPEFTPADLARALDLNPHTVRRVTKELAVAGELVEVDRYCGAPVYRAATIDESAATLVGDAAEIETIRNTDDV